jgi:hypothetical protein
MPLPPRRPVHEFNKRVVPELSALIERMLSKEPEARGTAREVAQAAESAAEHAGPEAKVPFLDLEWPEARVRAVPVRAAPAPAPEAVPAVERAEGGAQSWELRRALLAAAMSLAVVAMCLMAREPLSPTPSEVAQVDAPKAEWAPDAGTRSLGDDAMMTRVEAPASPVTSNAVAQKIPQQPFPRQRRPPCKNSWEVEINGGCWSLLAGSAPPCTFGNYEWQGACYNPSLEPPRPPTSEDPK